MANYLIIQTDDRTLYAGEGEIEDWTRIVGKVTKNFYRVISLYVTRTDNRPPRLSITPSQFLKEDNFQLPNDSWDFLDVDLDSNITGLIAKILEGIKR